MTPPDFTITVPWSVANVYREAIYAGTTIRGTWDQYRGAAVVMAITPVELDRHTVNVTLRPVEERKPSGDHW